MRVLCSRRNGAAGSVSYHAFPCSLSDSTGTFGIWGSEDPRTEEKLDEELKRKQGEWLEKAKKSAEPIFEQAHEILSRKGVPPENITTGFSQSIHRPDVVRELLEAAHHYQCGTIVVGREMYSSLKETFHRHVGEELVRQAQGVAVWVIAWSDENGWSRHQKTSSVAGLIVTACFFEIDGNNQVSCKRESVFCGHS
jgi:hypothetical protein